MRRIVTSKVTELRDIDHAEKFKQRTAESDSKRVVFAFFREANSSDFTAYKTVAVKAHMEADFDFAFSTDPVVATRYGVRLDSVQAYAIMWKNFDEGISHHSGDFTEEKLQEFIWDFGYPLLTSLDQARYLVAAQRNIALLWFFHDANDATVHEYHDLLEKIARDYRGRVMFMLVDVGTYGDKLTDMGLDRTQHPTGVLEDIANQRRFHLEKEHISEQGLVNFLQGFVMERLTPYIKSEPIPAEISTNVLKVVGNTFHKHVIESTDTMLLQIFAPWCEHSQKFAPVFEKLAERVESLPGLTLAKIDGTANDIPVKFKFEGFPTIYLVPKDDRETPIEFDGPRTFKDLRKFLKKHGFPLPKRQVQDK
eukprot:GFYU01027146.1.p1 GENE.GFYU01027146.1~~GFYU01027146.1.p1  ORF type:complete len:398 (+),score=2.05 GFYU01027146.1:97-1194(+)